MPVSPYEVLAPYQSLPRPRRMDRWAELHSAPPAQRALPIDPPEPEPAPEPEPVFQPPEPEPVPEPAPVPAPASPPPVPQHRFYDQIIRKHTAASRGVLMPATRRL